MGDVVNLRMARKDRRRDAAERAADANRRAHGRTKSERAHSAAEQALADRTLDGHRRDETV